MLFLSESTISNDHLTFGVCIFKQTIFDIWNILMGLLYKIPFKQSVLSQTNYTEKDSEIMTGIKLEIPHLPR